MDTLKIIVVLGLLGALVSIGLAFAWSAVSGRAVTGDEIARHALITFVVAACVVGVLRARAGPRS